VQALDLDEVYRQRRVLCQQDLDGLAEPTRRAHREITQHTERYTPPRRRRERRLHCANPGLRYRAPGLIALIERSRRHLDFSTIRRGQHLFAGSKTRNRMAWQARSAERTRNRGSVLGGRPVRAATFGASDIPRAPSTRPTARPPPAGARSWHRR